MWGCVLITADEILNKNSLEMSIHTLHLKVFFCGFEYDFFSKLNSMKMSINTPQMNRTNISLNHQPTDIRGTVSLAYVCKWLLRFQLNKNATLPVKYMTVSIHTPHRNILTNFKFELN